MPDAGLEYDEPGLVAVLRVNGQMFGWYVLLLGEGGLGGWIVSDRNAEMASVWLAVLGVVGGE